MTQDEQDAKGHGTGDDPSSGLPSSRLPSPAPFGLRSPLWADRLLLVALLTVSYQTAKAVLANPVKSLKSE